MGWREGNELPSAANCQAGIVLAPQSKRIPIAEDRDDHKEESVLETWAGSARAVKLREPSAFTW